MTSKQFLLLAGAMCSTIGSLAQDTRHPIPGPNDATQGVKRTFYCDPKGQKALDCDPEAFRRVIAGAKSIYVANDGPILKTTADYLRTWARFKVRPDEKSADIVIVIKLTDMNMGQRSISTATTQIWKSGAGRNGDLIWGCDYVAIKPDGQLALASLECFKQAVESAAKNNGK